jgi:hypothetical protein
LRCSLAAFSAGITTISLFIENLPIPTPDM